MKAITNKAAIYARVSTKRQAETGLSLEIQETKCKEWCANNGYIVSPDNIYIDDGYSGSLESRPAIDELRKAVEKKQFSLLVFYKADRIFREECFQNIFLRFLRENGVKFVSVTEEQIINSINGFDYNDEFITGIMGHINQRERSLIAERTKITKRELYKENKLHPGPIPYGYRKNENKDSPNCVEIDPETSQVYKRIVDLYFYQGIASNKISHVLNQEKINAPKYFLLTEKNKKKQDIGLTKPYKWTDTTILRIIKNECYTGEKWYLTEKRIDENGILKIVKVEGSVLFKYEPLISKKDWESMNRLRKKKKILPKKAHKDVAKNQFLVKAALNARNFACAICGSSIGARVNPRNLSLKYHCYKGLWNKERLKDNDSERCSLPWFDSDYIDGLVWGNICSYLSDPEEFYKELIEAPNIRPLAEEINVLQKKIDHAKNKIKRLVSDLSETDDPDTKKIILDERAEVIKEKDNFNKELSFKQQQWKEQKDTIDLSEQWKKRVQNDRKRKRKNDNEYPHGTIGKDGIRRKAIIAVGPFLDHLKELKFEDKRRILRQLINPTNGGKITLGFKKLPTVTLAIIDFQFRSSPQTVKSIIKSIGGSDAFIQRLLKPRQLCASR